MFLLMIFTVCETVTEYAKSVDDSGEQTPFQVVRITGTFPEVSRIEYRLSTDASRAETFVKGGRRRRRRRNSFKTFFSHSLILISNSIDRNGVSCLSRLRVTVSCRRICFHKCVFASMCVMARVCLCFCVYVCVCVCVDVHLYVHLYRHGGLVVKASAS